MATEACEEKVLDWAKYPGGASFVEPIEVTTDQDRMEAGRLFKAHGEVDFPNGFGTPVRGSYKCSVYLRNGLVENAEASVFGMKQ